MSTGAGVKRNDDGARSLWVGPAEERSRWRARGRRRRGVKTAKLPRSPLYKRGAEIMGAEVVFHYGAVTARRCHVWARRGAAVWIIVPLGKLWQ
jgi:hypothetical protein